MANMQKMRFSRLQHFFFLFLILGFSIGFWQLIAPFAYPIFWAAVIAIACYPVYKKVLSYLKKESISSFISVCLVVIFVFIPLSFISYILVNQLVTLYSRVTSPTFLTQISTFLSQLSDTAIGPYIQTAQENIIANSSNTIKNVTGTLLSSLRSITTASIKFVFQFFIMLYTLYYFFKDGPYFLKRLMHLSPLGDQYEQMLYDRFTSTTRATLKSTLIIGGIQGVVSGILFAIAGIKGAILWGFFMVIVGIIPAFGPTLFLYPIGIFYLLTGGVWQGVMMLVGGTLISLVDNLLRPPLVGKDIQMHPLLVLFATLGGLALFGVPGFIIGPIIAALFISIISMYDYFYKKELDNN